MSYVSEAIKEKSIYKMSKKELREAVKELRNDYSNALDHLNEVMDKHHKVCEELEEANKYKEQLDKLFNLLC